MLRFSFADPNVPRADRGSAEPDLSERAGWERRHIPTRIRGQMSMIEAMCNGELAVNKMVESEGFAISLANTGFRISYDGAVFARSADAMSAAEMLMSRCRDWICCQTARFTDAQRESLREVIKMAERDGAILIDKVYPV